ncbi:MAG: hypothetical protein HY800_08105 [Ignavibacteriales bacterium]|nr:hypothetical protein [Ignavibacteriales bacterium]
MNKKLWIGFIVVFIGMAVLNFIIHGIILTSAYQTEEVNKFMRSEAEMNSLMWIYYVIYLIQSFFFTFIFSKGYEGKGIMEGVRYGLYMGLLLATPMAYASYAMYPMPYSLALQWFIYGMIYYIILGILLAAIYGKKAKETPAS